MALDSLHLDRMALTPAPGGEATAECPFCGAKRGHFYVNPTKGVYYCHRCGASGRVSGPPRIPSVPCDPTVETASPDRLDRVYRVLLRVLTLSEEHREHLLAVRGMSPEQVKANGYRTLPHGRRLEIARKVADMCDPSGVPGFYRLYGEWNLAGYPGLLIPVRDWDGRIVGCQIRTFEPSESDLPKYLWLSSAGKEGGASASIRAHVVHGSKDARSIWLTEGPLKADVSAPRLGKLVVAIPGVNTLRPSLAEEMKRRGCRRVVLAFDSDAYTNPRVAQALEKALTILSDAGLDVQVATWPQDHKGLDDLLLAGKKPRLGRFRRADKTVNQVFLSGYVKRVTVGDVTSSRGEDKLRKMTIVIDDPQGHPIPALAFSKVAGSLESQNPEPGDWIEAEGRIKSWPGRYAEISANVVLTSARVLKKMQPAWWEVEPESQDAAGSTERQSST